MGIRFDGSSDRYSRSSDVPLGGTNAFTFMMWVKIVTDRNDWTCFSWFSDAGNDDYYYLGTGGTGTLPQISITRSGGGSGSIVGSEMTVGQWHHLAYIRNSSGDPGGFELFQDGVSQGTTNVSPLPNFTKSELGNDPSNEFLNGEMAGVKYWQIELSLAEILNEMLISHPLRTANLFEYHPLWNTGNDEVDYSGNGRNLTVAGTPANAGNPPIIVPRRHKRIIIPAGVAPTFPITTLNNIQGGKLALTGGKL